MQILFAFIGLLLVGFSFIIFNGLSRESVPRWLMRMSSYKSLNKNLDDYNAARIAGFAVGLMIMGLLLLVVGVINMFEYFY